MKSNRVSVTGWVVVIALLAALTAGAALAQHGPGRMGGPGGPRGFGEPGGPGGPPPAPPVIMKAGADGVFVLTGRTLTKYGTALEEKGSLKLGEQGSTSTADDQPPAPPKSGAMLLTIGAGAKVLVLIGDEFFSVDAASLQVGAKVKLPAIQAPQDSGQGVPPGPRPMPPVMELSGHVLYVLRGPQIVGVNVADGTLVGPVTLPKPPEPGNGQ